MALTQYVRLTLGGTMPSGETWSVGMSFTFTGTVTAAQLNTWLAAVDAVCVTHLAPAGGIRALMAQQTKIVSLRAAVFAPSASSSSVTAQRNLTTPILGTGSFDHPNQIAICMSTHSGLAGKRFNGRMYWPCDGAQVQGDTHQLLLAQLTPAVTKVRDFMVAVAATTLGTTGLAAAIAVPGAGLASPITALTMDSVCDTQRRRRKSVVPVATATIAVP